MKSKTTLILFVVFTILLLAVILVERAGEDRAKSAAAARPLFPDVTAETAQQIDISGLGNNVVLKKKDGEWVVATSDDYPADPDGVKRILEKVEGFEKKDVVSTQESKHALFNVDAAKGIHVQVSGDEGKVLADFYVGKAGPDYQSTYLRVEGKPDVLLIPESLRSVFYRGTRTWRDRYILNIPKESITGLEVQQDGETYILSTSDGESWQIIDANGEETAAKSQPVGIMLTNLSKLTADDWAAEQGPDALAKYHLDPPNATVTIMTADGKTYRLAWGDENDKKQSYVKREDRDTIFLVGHYRRANILKSAEDLKEESPASPPAPAPPK